MHSKSIGVAGIDENHKRQIVLLSQGFDAVCEIFDGKNLLPNYRIRTKIYEKLQFNF